MMEMEITDESAFINGDWWLYRGYSAVRASACLTNGVGALF